VARLAITPDRPVYLSGYAVRTKPSEGKAHDLWAKALAIQDAKRGRVVIVGTDLIGLPRNVTDVVAARVQKEYGLERSRLMLNSSHTHSGPLIRGNLEMFELTPEESEAVSEYTRKLTDRLVTVIGGALAALQPASLEFGNGRASFGQNRRTWVKEKIQFGENPGGPSDPDVPVLKVAGADGKLLAVLFGYACHNTTLTGEFYRFSGDYAGFAQIDLEQSNPGATALFLMLCGADQNPAPRGTLELAERHGAALAAEVDRVIHGAMQPVRGQIRTAFQIVEIPFAHHTRQTFEAEARNANKFKARRARAMLKLYDERRPVRKYPYPVQAIGFGKDLTMVALGGEVVVDYVLRAKKELGAKGLIVAGYSNDVMSYIPSVRILREGGYEAEDSMIYYGQPGRYTEDVEELIFGALRSAVRRVRR
jgi:hypothetical protein